MISGVDFLKYLTRFGLDKKVLYDYRQFGTLYCSEVSHNGEHATPYEFIDFAGIDYAWIDKLVEVENEYNLSVYHIIHTKTDEQNGPEFVCLFYYNGLHLETQLNSFKTGVARCFRFYPQQDLIDFGECNYQVRFGGVVDKSVV